MVLCSRPLLYTFRPPKKWNQTGAGIIIYRETKIATLAANLFSGAGGFVSTEIIYQLLELGWEVHGTARNLNQTEKYDFLNTVWYSPLPAPTYFSQVWFPPAVYCFLTRSLKSLLIKVASSWCMRLISSYRAGKCDLEFVVAVATIWNSLQLDFV